MKKESRTVVYDDALRLEAYRFEGIVQPFPSHFHEYYVIGFVEKGVRELSRRDREYTIEEDSIVLFNPGDSHACAQCDGGTFDYRGVVTSAAILREPVTWVSAAGTVMAVAGLFLSEYSGKGKQKTS